jgi:Dolichyl-phosphate-mannose-protein mannosyltransferase
MASGSGSDRRLSGNDSAFSPPSLSRYEAGDAIPVVIVLVVAFIFATSMLVDYAANPGELWHGLLQDRNVHFDAALQLAVALRNFDVVTFLGLLLEPHIWPPAADLSLAVIMILGGMDLRLAILPGLIGWACAMVLIFLIARRLFSDRWTGNVAGALAVTFALASPAFRLISADVMLEGPGAALTAFCLYAYIRARAKAATGSERWWDALAIGLTVLFFEKYNYWLMIAIALAIAYVSEDLSGWLRWIRTRAAMVTPDTARAIIRDPFIIAASCLVVLELVIFAIRPMEVDLFDVHVVLRDAWKDVATAIWAVLFVRAVLLWRKYRKPFDTALGIPGRQVFYWHLLPIGIFFLIPKRLVDVLYFVGANWGQKQFSFHPLHAVSWQWLGFSQGFHVAPWIAILVLVLAAVSAVGLSRLDIGARAVMVLAALSAAAVILHPNQEWRFQASWIFSVWILAGAGGALILSVLTTRLGTFARVAIAAAAVAGLAAVESRYGWTDMAYAAASHPRPGERSDLDFAKAYLPYVRGGKKIGFLTTLAENNFYGWTLREDCRCEAKVYAPAWDPAWSREQYRSATAAWLMQTRLDFIVAIDSPSGEIPAPGYDALSGRIDAIKQDRRFYAVATEPVPSFGATISIFRRR